MKSSAESRTAFGLLAAVMASFLLVAWVGRPPAPLKVTGPAPALGILPDQAYQFPDGALRFDPGKASDLLVAHGADGQFMPVASAADLPLDPDHAAAARLLATPISLNWRHPLNGLPVADVFRVAIAGDGVRSEERLHTYLFQRHAELPVVSLVMSTGALIDPDTGLLVVGNAIFDAPRKMAIAEARDPKWWKYPGNFHMRGKEWERSGRMQLIAPDGSTFLESAVRVRVNGQMTRGFPQHALRLGFEEPVLADVFKEEVGKGYEAWILRTAGNDQVKAMLRDVFQHELCHGLPFETSPHLTCVAYLNGAYWGVHHLRPRMDEYEIARRYGIKRKHITILEDEARLYRGDSAEVVRFERLAARTRAWDGVSSAWADTLNAQVDVDGFLTYMASQMILGNMDWPNQNVRFWRYTGKPRQQRPLDGRWYFIMGDSDLGYGAQASANADMFERARIMDVPITRLFWGMMRSPQFRARFMELAQGLVKGPFATERAEDLLNTIVTRIEPEMDRHTARWRKPSNKQIWLGHVEVMRAFARQRGPAVLEQLKAFAELP
jgi:CotH kinase protein